MVEPVIEIDGLTKRYGEILALDNLSLTVPRGIIFGFLGPNGAGKTTAINLLLGLTEPTSGSASVLGFDTVAESGQVRERVGVLLDDNGLYDQLSAYENLEFYTRIWRIPRERSQARIKEVLSDLDLWSRRHDRAGSWSRGMRQRLALARAQLNQPELLFLDEPTAGLDVLAAQDVRTRLSAAAAAGATIFLTTHNMTEAEQLCGRVAIINSGRLVAVGEPSSILSTAGYKVRIGGANLDRAAEAIAGRSDVLSLVAESGQIRLTLRQPDPSEVIRVLMEAGASVHEVQRGTRLEDAFVEFVRPSHAQPENESTGRHR